MTDNFPVHEEQEDGWSEWVSPRHDSYQMACCDCGLIHEMQFKVVRFTGEKHDDGDEHCEPVDDPDVQAIFRARRNGVLPDSELRAEITALRAEIERLRVGIDAETGRVG